MRDNSNAAIVDDTDNADWILKSLISSNTESVL